MVKLNLYNSLFYEKIPPEKADLHNSIGKNEERLLCFDLNPDQSCSICPEKDLFIGSLVFIGQKTGEMPDKQMIALPKGNYLFVQQREAKVLSREEWLDLAIEQQKDGLWERNKLGNRLYVRFLYEDGAFTTQVFRELPAEKEENKP